MIFLSYLHAWKSEFGFVFRSSRAGVQINVIVNMPLLHCGHGGMIRAIRANDLFAAVFLVKVGGTKLFNTINVPSHVIHRNRPKADVPWQ